MTDSRARKLSVLIPVYNEEATVGAVLEQVRQVDLSPLGLTKQMIVVDDGSTDHSAEIVRRWLAEHPEVEARQIIRERNRGKGYALHRALEAADGEFVIVQDADLEYDPQDWRFLLVPLTKGEAEVVFGSRCIPLGPEQKRRRIYNIGLAIAQALIFMLYGRRLSDVATGYKALRTDLLRSLRLERPGFDFCPEVTVKLLNRKIPILELPISYRPRFKEHGKKIRWHDFFAAMYTIVRFRLRDPFNKSA